MDEKQEEEMKSEQKDEEKMNTLATLFEYMNGVRHTEFQDVKDLKEENEMGRDYDVDETTQKFIPTKASKQDLVQSYARDVFVESMAVLYPGEVLR